MDCESPPGHTHRVAPPPAHQGSRSQGGWGEGGHGGSSLHTGHQFTTHRGHHHHHHGGHISGPLAPIQSSTTSLSSTSSSSSSALPGPQNLGMPGHAYPLPADASHPHPQRPGPAGGGVLSSATSVPVDLSTLHHGQSAAQGAGLQGIEPQLGSLSMQLGGYPPSAQYSQFPQQGWPAGYPFTVAQGNPSSVPQTLAVAHEGSVPPPGAHNRTGGEPRGEESPMMGVCVQQSPVASHWPIASGLGRSRGSTGLTHHCRHRGRLRPGQRLTAQWGEIAPSDLSATFVGQCLTWSQPV